MKPTCNQCQNFVECPCGCGYGFCFMYEQTLGDLEMYHGLQDIDDCELFEDNGGHSYKLDSLKSDHYESKLDIAKEE